MDYKEQQKHDEIELRKIFKNDSIIVVYQGDTINFAHPLNTPILEEQLQQTLDLDYKLIQTEAIINRPGMSDHLHVHLHKIQEWEKKK